MKNIIEKIQYNETFYKMAMIFTIFVIIFNISFAIIIPNGNISISPSKSDTNIMNNNIYSDHNISIADHNELYIEIEVENNTSNNVREEIHDLGIEAINITDAFLGFSMSASLASSKMWNLYHRLNNLYDEIDDITETERVVRVAVGNITIIIPNGASPISSSDSVKLRKEILEIRNILAQQLEQNLRENWWR